MKPRKALLTGLAALGLLSVLFALPPASASDHTVESPELIEPILWCRGCTPTSAAMVLTYWDNYKPTAGAYMGMGRLIEYWMDLSYYSDGTGPVCNVPNVLEELRVAMHTDGRGETSTGDISSGIRNVTNDINGYSFLSDGSQDWPWNDHCWGTITDEINASRPFVWSVGKPNTTHTGHSLCAWGYTDSKFVICYNTWNAGREDWYYDKYNNGDDSTYTYVHTVVPRGWDGDNQLFLTSPTGGESWAAGDECWIYWYQYGTEIIAVWLYYSIDGGTNWTPLTSNSLTSVEGWNHYVWTVPEGINSTRVRLFANGVSHLREIASDGTKANCTIRPRLHPPTVVTATCGTYTDRIRIAWSSATGATHYRVYTATQPGGPLVPLTPWQTSRSYDDANIGPVTDYYYWVTAAVDNNGRRESDPSAMATGWRALAPPAYLDATDGLYPGAVNLWWNQVSSADKYQVARSDTPDGPKTDLTGWLADNWYWDLTPIPGRDYYYWVRAMIDGYPGRPSAYSYDVGWSQLDPPLHVRATQGDYTGRVQVTWDPEPWAVQYRVARADSPTGPKTESPWLTGTSYDDTSAVPGVDYYYFVQACTEFTAHPSIYSVGVPGWRAFVAAPTNVHASKGTYIDRVHITWDPVPGADEYRACRSTAVDAFKTSISAWQAGTSFDDTTGQLNVGYCYWVQARANGHPERESVFSAYDEGWRTVPHPANVNASDGTYTDKVRITWDPVPGASHYRVYAMHPPRDIFRVALGTWQTGTTYDDAQASPGSTAYYWVRAALDATGANASSYSDYDEGWRALEPPQNVAASDGSFTDSVLVTWTPSSLPNCFYQVYRSTSLYGAGTPLSGWIAPISAKYYDTSATPTVTYYYGVQVALDATGLRASEYRASASGWRAMAAPLNVVATDGSDSRLVHITWDAVPGATHYLVSRSLSPSAPEVALGAVQHALVFDDTTATPGVDYYYWVQAAASITPDHPSLYSAPDAGWRALPATEHVAASDGTYTDKVRVTWPPVAGASYYRITRTIPPRDPNPVYTPWMPGTTYDDTTAAPGTTYSYYVVAALDDTGYRANKGQSDTGWLALPPPANVAASDGTYSYVRVTWTGAKGYYRVYRSTSLDGAKQSVSGWISALGYNDTSAASGVLYWYWVQAAMDSKGFHPSDYSAPDTGWWGLPPQHTLAVTNGSGSGTYDVGTVVQIVAVVPPDHRFDRWTGDVQNVADICSASTTITMWSDAVVAAVFRLNGDTNGDDCVNVIDLLIVRNDMGKHGSGLAGDVCGNDNVVNVADLIYVRNRLGNECR